jgi:hypothetical protein
MAVQVRIFPEFQDVLELNTWAWPQRVKGYIAVGFGLLMALGCVVDWAVRENAPNPLLGVGAGVMFILIGLIATRLTALGAWLRRSARRPYLVEVSPEGVAVTNEGKERACAGWEPFKPYYETPNLLVLPIRHAGDALMIPKRCCSAEQLAELRDLLTQRGTPIHTTN